MLAWDKAHDVRLESEGGYFKTASILQGGKYFLRFNENRISEEFQEIQNITPLREFYEYYNQKIREIEDKFGMNLGPGFIAEVKKTLTEASMNNKSLREMSENVLDNLQIREHDVLTQGNRDINTQ